ncbi:MAG: efflux RND transporter periplasmic adaptor subunit [Chromatiales bacterium]|jgi:RND family efflux transporter MFP subunit
MKKILPSLFLMGLSLSLQAGNLISISTDQRDAFGIRTSTLERVESAISTAYPAKVVVPNAQLRVVSAPQGGLLATLLVSEGESVQAGQPLAQIQSPQLLEQQSAYLEALTRLQLARADYQRDSQLKKEGIIAERRYLETRSRLTQEQTVVEQLRQSLSLAGMDEQTLTELAKRRKLSGSLQVRSPLDGVVLEQIATPGQRLEMADPLYKVGQLSPLWLEIHVPLEKLGVIAPGSRVHSGSISARVITVGRMVHGADQGVLVRAEVTDGAERLRPGQFVQANLQGPDNGNLFRVPRSALVRSGGASYVFVESPDGFDARPVEVRVEETDHIIISGEFAADTRIATSGTASLKAAWQTESE